LQISVRKEHRCREINLRIVSTEAVSFKRYAAAIQMPASKELWVIGCGDVFDEFF
jgi:hypothetical protein